MKKHYVLVSAEKPQGDGIRDSQVWSNFLSKTQKIEDQTKGIRKLGENSWLIDRENAASALTKIVSAAELSDMKYDVWYLSSD